jgi:hypothetical protein
MYLDLDRGKLEALESMRNGGGLSFSMGLFGTSVEGGRHSLTSTQLAYTAAQGVWVPILEKMGYEKRLLLEVPMPDPVVSPHISGAVQHLEKAQRQLALGYAREAVGACRDALESLKPFLGDTGQDLGDAQKRSKKDRLLNLRRALHQITHPAHHADPAAAQFDYGRIDAVSIISSVAGLIGWADRLAKEGKL